MKHRCKIVFLHNNSEFVPLKRMVWSKKKKLCTECYNNFYQFFWLHLKFVWNRLADTASILNLYFFPNTSISYNSVASYLLANSLWRGCLIHTSCSPFWFLHHFKYLPVQISSCHLAAITCIYVFWAICLSYLSWSSVLTFGFCLLNCIWWISSSLLF